MVQNCTLFCTSGSAEQLCRNAKKNARGKHLKVEGFKHDWEAIGYSSSETNMTINRLVHEDENDGFKKVIERTQSFVQSIETENDQAKAALLAVLSKTTQIFGVVFEPSLDEISEDIIFSFLEMGKGVLFTGNDFLNAEGGLILNIEGISEEGTLVPTVFD